jgi:glycosyltransferase involved in cell wall biosynthesis
MRICFICNEYPPASHGGIGTMTQVLARGLAAAGHEVRVIGAYPVSRVQNEQERDGDVGVWRLREPDVRGGGLLARFLLFRRLAQWVRSGEIDLIEVPDWEGWAAWWPSLPVPIVARLHGSSTYFATEMGRAPAWLTARCERASLLRADFWCSVSNYTADRTRTLFGLPSGPDAILRSTVDIAAFPDGADVRSRSDVAFTGTLTAKKGIVSLIDAWPLVRQHSAGARLHIYGKDGRTEAGSSMQAFLVARLAPHDRDSVAFHGHTPRATLLSRLAEARVAVFPSYAEACAIAPLEAMACGCATVSSNRGSGVELFTDGVHGLLIDPDDREAIAMSIVRLLNDDDLASRLARAGREHVRRAFSTAVLLEQNAAFYRECVERFRGGVRKEIVDALSLQADKVEPAAPRQVYAQPRRSVESRRM